MHACTCVRICMRGLWRICVCAYACVYVCAHMHARVVAHLHAPQRPLGTTERRRKLLGVARQVGRVPVGNAAHLATPNFLFWGIGRLSRPLPKGASRSPSGCSQPVGLLSPSRIRAYVFAYACARSREENCFGIDRQIARALAHTL